MSINYLNEDLLNYNFIILDKLSNNVLLLNVNNIDAIAVNEKDLI